MERVRVATSSRDANFDAAPATDRDNGQPTGTLDFIAEAHAAMGYIDEWDRLRRLHATIDAIDPADMAAAAQQVRQLPSGEQWTVAWVLGERWASFDAAGAMAFAQKLSPNEGRQAIIDGMTWPAALEAARSS